MPRSTPPRRSKRWRIRVCRPRIGGLSPNRQCKIVRLCAIVSRDAWGTNIVGQEIDPFEGAPPTPKIVAVSLQQTGHLYNFLAGDAALRRGDRVLVESETGTRVGTVEIEPHEPARSIDLSAMRSIVRVA